MKRYILYVAGALLLLAIAGPAIRYFTADIRGRIDANETIKSGSNRIAQYDNFFNMCAAVQADEARLDALEAESLQATTQEDKSRISANISGVLGHRAQLIAQYNANATKSYTSAQFRDSDLPYKLFVEDMETSCAA